MGENVDNKVFTDEEIDALRKKYRNADIIWKTASVFVVLLSAAFVVALFKKWLSFELMIDAIIALVILLLIFFCVYLLPHFLKMSSKLKEYSTAYKAAFLRPTLEDAFSDGSYKDYDKVSTKDLTKISMLKKARSAEANDCVRGNYNGISFSRYDLALRYGKKKATSTCVMIVADIKTHIRHEVQIVNKDFNIGGMTYEQPEDFCKILSSNESFDKKYNIYAKEQDEGKKFADDRFVNKIAKFKAGGPIAVFADNDNVYLIVRKKRDAMEAPVYNSVKRKQAVKEAKEEVDLIKDWMDILKTCV